MSTLLLACLATAAIAASPTASPLAWQTHQVGRWADLKVPKEGRAGFTTVPAETTQITFVNRLPEDRSLTNPILLNGSGVALGDVDGDGWCDIFFAGLGGGSALYRNLGGWKFSEITTTAFAPDKDGKSPFARLDATGAVFADINGDGLHDLIVNGVGTGTCLFQNEGGGRFREVTAAAGLTGVSGATSPALADGDGDGDLDLYVVNYRSSTIRDSFQLRLEVKVVNGRTVVRSRSVMKSGRLVGRQDPFSPFVPSATDTGTSV